MEQTSFKAALRTAIIYFVVACAWIIISDFAVAQLSASGAVDRSDPLTIVSTLQTVKGWAFVIVTAIALFFLLRSEFLRQAQVQDELSESERARATLIGNLPGMVYRCRNDPKWTMEYLSEGCLQLTGYSPEALIDNEEMAYADLIHPEDRDMVWDTVQQAVARGERFQITYRIMTASGAQKWVWEQGTATPAPGSRNGQLEGFITDVTETVHYEQQLKQQLEHVQALRAIDLAITSSLDERLTFEVLLDQVTSELGIHAAALLLYDHQNHILKFALGRGFRTDALRHTYLRPGEGHAGRVAVEREIVQVEDLRTDPGGFEQSPAFKKEGFVFYCAAPLITKAQVRGVLELFHRAPLHPDEEWTDFLEILAGQAAIALDNATLFDELQRSNTELVQAYDQTLEGWALALEMRDQETEGHTRRVTELSVRLAREMGVRDDDIVHLRRGALLHDIGKMAIPDEILLKPGPLDEEEWALMRRHPEIARQLLSRIGYLQPALEIPYCHHEKWDGSGYPRGLSEESIPLSARIFAVVDVWDALLSDRPYRQAWPEQKVLSYLADQRGQHFDPAVLDSFLEIVAEA